MKNKMNKSYTVVFDLLPMTSILHSSLLFSIVVQVVTGVIEVLTLFVKTPPAMALIRQLLGLEVAVQAVEGAFYVWLYKNIATVKNITPKRYADWALTTPTMLITLIAYIIYLNSDKGDDKGENSLSLIQILRENATPIAQILVLNWLMLLFGYLGEVGVIPLLTGVALGFAPFIAYFYLIYERFVANDANNNNNDTTSLKIYAYFLVFWSLYGIVAVLPYTLKNTIYNMLDLFAKNFFGLFLSYLIVSNATNATSATNANNGSTMTA
jgi:bacteriorhodopsin